MKNNAPTLIITRGGESLPLEKWQSIYGQDAESVVLNPKFKSPESFDFTPDDNSGLYELGFEKISDSVSAGR